MCAHRLGNAHVLIRVSVCLCYVHARMHAAKLCERTALLRACPKLQHLDLSFCRGLSGDGVTTAINGCPSLNLRSLNVEGCGGHFDENFLLDINSAHLCELRKINLSHCCEVGDEAITGLVHRSPKMCDMNLDGLRFLTQIGVSEIATRTGSCLTALVLDGADLSDNALLAVTAQCTNLKKLALSFGEDFTDVGLASLARLPALESLKIRKGILFTNDGFRALFSDKRLGPLQEIDLTECAQLRDDSVMFLAENCPGLKQCNLSWCWELTDAGIASIINNCRCART